MFLKLLLLYGFITLILVVIAQGIEVVKAEHRLVIIEEDALLVANCISLAIVTYLLVRTSPLQSVIPILVLIAIGVCTTTYYNLLEKIDVNFQLAVAVFNTIWLILLLPVAFYFIV